MNLLIKVTATALTVVLVAVVLGVAVFILSSETFYSVRGALFAKHFCVEHREAEKLLRAGDSVNAEKELKKSITKGCNKSFALLGDLLHRQGRSAEAITVLKRGYLRSEAAKRKLIKVLIAEGRTKDVRVVLEEWIKKQNIIHILIWLGSMMLYCVTLAGVARTNGISSAACVVLVILAFWILGKEREEHLKGEELLRATRDSVNAEKELKKRNIKDQLKLIDSLKKEKLWDFVVQQKLYLD